MAYPVTDLAEYFEGRWGVRRDILDSAGTVIGAFIGSADFHPRDDRLVYHERGVLELGVHRGPAHRTLHYCVTGPGVAEVYFDYGDFFHGLDLRQGWWRAAHPCRDDLYRGEYEVLDRRRWRLTWTVAGPTKDHTLVSRFERDAGGQGPCRSDPRS